MNKLSKIFIGLLMTTTIISPTTATETIVKSDNDKRDYAYTTLDNGLKLLVISDPKAQRSAAAVDVDAGTSAEPEKFPGLAHFLEHMLFLGTDKYPDPDDYINYISDHGGNHNAFTAFDHTNYFFDIDPDYLHEGLKRFSRFFVAPLMSEKYVERERNAVDSEYQSKLREDGWRTMDTLKAAINPKHPYARFSIGNKETLPNASVRPALLEFYKKYYSSDRMSAVIIGKEDTDTLTTWGKELFSDVPKRDKTDLSITEKFFDGIKLPIEIQSQSIKSEKNLSLYFQFPYSLEAEYSKSLGYLSYVLGYEGDGGLLEALKKQGYATELYSGAGYRVGNETSFEIGVQLTDKGYAHKNNVISIIFAYLELFNNDSNAQSRYEEIATTAKTAFQFKEKYHAMSEVSGLATRLNRYAAKDVQALNSIFGGYNHQEVTNYLSQMKPEDVVTQLTAPDINSNTKTQYFNVPYTINNLTPSELTKIAEDDMQAVQKMHLPNTNPFIANDYALKKADDSATENHEVLENGVELYFKHDTTFNVPKSSVQISIQPTIDLSIADKTAMTLLAAIVDEQLTTVLYDASIAGLNVEIAAGEKSIAISLEGYQQKIPELLEVILKNLKNITIESSIFDRVKNEYRQNLENTSTKMPYIQTFPYLNNALIEDSSLPEQRLLALDKINKETVTTLANKILPNLAIRMMVYGNNTYAEAKQLGIDVGKALNDSNLNHKWQTNSPTVITTNHIQSFKSDHSDSAITYYIQGDNGYEARAKVGLLAKMLEPQFFTKLRTEQQLGYVVFAYPKPTFNQSGIAFTIQSPVVESDELQEHIRSFNETFSKGLNDLDDNSLNEIKNILKREMLQKPENLVAAADLYWSDILTTSKTESSRKAIANEIDKVTLKQFVNSMQALLDHGKSIIIKAQPHK
ncbi:MAG: insulinase family protein [Gammaproteobacteria bacterium]|nr:insulinase family protein [Gammaproteobacteria bacterium]